MITEKLTSKVFKSAVIVSLALIVIGLVVYMSIGNDSVVEIGILFLIISPLIAVLFAMASLAKNKEWSWVIAAAIMVIITIIGVMVAKL